MSTQRIASSRLPTQHGEYRMLAYTSPFPEFPHVALERITDPEATVPVRIHSECMTGDVFGSVRCDCGEQLKASMAHFEEHGGLMIYLRHEGRGIGLVSKMKAYNLQDQGVDTVEANHALGFHTDERDFSPALEILKDLGVSRIQLLTNNPEKVHTFDGTGIEVVERLPLEIKVRPENQAYLSTKANTLGHFLHQF